MAGLSPHLRDVRVFLLPFARSYLLCFRLHLETSSRHLAGDVLHMRPKPDPRGLMAQEASRFNASNSEDFCIRSEQLNARSTGDCEAHASAQTNISGSAPVMGRTPDGHPQALPEHEGHPF